MTMGVLRAVVVLGAALLVVNAQPVDAAPVLDAGWEFHEELSASDTVLAAATDSEGSPYVYDLAAPAIFRITDEFIPGDVWSVFDFGALILTTAFVAFPVGFGDNAVADNGWTSAEFSSGEVLLAPGLHSISVQGDGAGGLPARFFVRLDSVRVNVPEPGSLLLLGTGLAGVSGLAWRQRRRIG